MMGAMMGAMILGRVGEDLRRDSVMVCLLCSWVVVYASHLGMILCAHVVCDDEDDGDDEGVDDEDVGTV